MYGWIDRWVDRWMDRWMEERKKERVEGRMELRKKRRFTSSHKLPFPTDLHRMPRTEVWHVGNT